MISVATPIFVNSEIHVKIFCRSAFEMLSNSVIGRYILLSLVHHTITTSDTSYFRCMAGSALRRRQSFFLQLTSSRRLNWSSFMIPRAGLNYWLIRYRVWKRLSCSWHMTTFNTSIIETTGHSTLIKSLVNQSSFHRNDQSSLMLLIDWPFPSWGRNTVPQKQDSKLNMYTSKSTVRYS